MSDLSKQFRALKGFIKEESLMNYEGAQAEMYGYYSLMDARELIEMIGLRNFLESLVKETKGRELTIEEIEAMEVLHNHWEL